MPSSIAFFESGSPNDLFLNNGTNPIIPTGPTGRKFSEPRPRTPKGALVNGKSPRRDSGRPKEFVQRRNAFAFGGRERILGSGPQ